MLRSHASFTILLVAATSLSAQELDFRGPPGSGKPSLVAGADGRVILTWFEPTGGERHALRFAVRERGKWSEPGTIHESTRFFVNWADFPSLVETGDGTWVVHWLQKTVNKPYAYHVILAASHDRGRTWSAPIPVHADQSDTEHGFVAMLPGRGGDAEVVWLDGRRMDGPERGAMSVMTRTVRSSRELGPEIELDGMSCECCQTALARTGSGLIAAWRDRSPGEVRDIVVARETDGRWSEPRVAAADGWVHRACPVNGPALAADGDRVALAWYTAVDDAPRVWLIQSTDGGRSFGNRLRIDEGRTLGRLDLERLGGGAVAVVWLEQAGEEADWRVRRVEADGRSGQARTLLRVSRARLAGFPRMAVSAGDLLVAVTATGEGGGVRVLRASLPPARP
jgi:hypothetical protein